MISPKMKDSLFSPENQTYETLEPYPMYVADVPADTPKIIALVGTWHWVSTTVPPDGIWKDCAVVAAVEPEPSVTNRLDGPPLVTTRSLAYAP